jgi:L-asparagine transporter-like permease
MDNLFEGFEFWAALWKYMLVIALVVFGALSVWVSIGGFFDVKKLLKQLKEGKDQDEAKPE